MLGVVENMSDIRIPFSSLADPLAGISLVTKDGQDVTQHMVQRYVMVCNYYSMYSQTFVSNINFQLLCILLQNPRHMSRIDGSVGAIRSL